MILEFKDSYSWLSNFASVDIILDGITYPSVEHAYMSAKSDDINWKNYCSDKNNHPGSVKKESKKIQLKTNWGTIRVDIMRECLNQKFSKEPYLTKLLNTGVEYIQEGNSWGDEFWGVSLKTGDGENMLGKIIMEIRSKLRIKNVYMKTK